MDIKRLLRKEAPAPLWKRAVAYLIDVLVLALVLAPLQPMDVSYDSLSVLVEQFAILFSTFQFIFSILLVLLLSLAYWTLLEYNYQQTLGKYLLHLRVISEEKHLRFSQCLLRNISKLSSLLLFADVLYMLFSHTSQRYSETLAHTEVVTHV
ncbi:MAG TPA: RDD family protein [Candidatus Nanoarchaeia archaeon]|nr:RDD family protein [Candidatus Nanoarchaeia archaeon]